MKNHIYAFGSICRGDVDGSSDIDLLAIVDGHNERFNPNEYSIYSYSRIDELWKEGNAFAWHLHLESKLIFSTDGNDHLKSKKQPSRYTQGRADCKKFIDIFLSAKESLSESNLTEVFDLSSVFLSIRNFATCYSLANCNTPDFSRNSATNLGMDSIQLDGEVYRIFERARLLCTRGSGDLLNDNEITKAKSTIPAIELWMLSLLNKKEMQ
jgi:hypothetical protein